MRIATSTFRFVPLAACTLLILAGIAACDSDSGTTTTDNGATDVGQLDTGSPEDTMSPDTTGTDNSVTPDPGNGEDPGTADLGATDPGATDPGTTDPGTTDPGTTDPGETADVPEDVGTTDAGDATTDVVHGTNNCSWALECIGACETDSCVHDCGAETTATGWDLLLAGTGCIFDAGGACPATDGGVCDSNAEGFDGDACNMCTTQASSAGGACYTEVVACYADE